MRFIHGIQTLQRVIPSIFFVQKKKIRKFCNSRESCILHKYRNFRMLA